MRKFCKKLILISTAAVMALGAGALSACDGSFTPPQGDAKGDVVSNGGFVVEKGDYVYFINGVEAYTADNTYNKVVKSALQRISKTDLEKGNGSAAQTVIPSLMTAGDHTSGFYIYGDKIYYTTPNNVKNTSGVIENDYLDFKSANLDGTDIKSYFRTPSNSTSYRFVDVDNAVYAIYEDNSTLYSYNTATGKETKLATSVSEYVLCSSEKTDPYIYYTKEVVDGIDQDSPNALSYNQIYRVRADVTEETAPYKFEWDQDYLEEHDGEEPYVNLGEIVLDGIGAGSIVTEFTHDLKEGVTPATPNGYTYTLQSYANNGLYFTRTEIVKTGSDGEDGKLYFLPADKLGNGWNSISGNGGENLDVIAQDTTKASSAAIFYYETVAGGRAHHYIYVDGSTIKRADVDANGIAVEQRIAYNVSGATLMYLDNTSDAAYKYVYFNRSNGNGLSVERAVYNGTEENYNNLGYDANKPYQPVKVLNLQHASDWYNYEMINGRLYFADAEQFGSNSYNYVASVNLNNASGKLMNNEEIEAFNENYEKITDYISELSEENDKLSKLYNCYFYTESTEYYEENLKEATDAGKEIYNEDDIDAFLTYVAGTSDVAKKFLDGEKSYRIYSYFVTAMGTRTEADEDTLAAYWKAELEHYTPPTTEEELLPWWAWTLIGVGCGLVVIGVGLAIFFVLRAKKHKAEAPAPQRMRVDTTDDKEVDVYNKDTVEEQAAPEEGLEKEASEEIAEVEAAAQTEETAEETPAAAEEPAEEAPAEVPAEEVSETAPETSGEQ